MFKNFFVALLCGAAMFCLAMWMGDIQVNGVPDWQVSGWFAGLVFCAVWAGYTMAYKGNQK